MYRSMSITALQVSHLPAVNWWWVKRWVQFISALNSANAAVNNKAKTLSICKTLQLQSFAVRPSNILFVRWIFSLFTKTFREKERLLTESIHKVSNKTRLSSKLSKEHGGENNFFLCIYKPQSLRKKLKEHEHFDISFLDHLEKPEAQAWIPWLLTRLQRTKVKT